MRLVVSLDDGGEMDVLTAMLLPALGTYDGRLVLITEPAISCTYHPQMHVLLQMATKPHFQVI